MKCLNIFPLCLLHNFPKNTSKHKIYKFEYLVNPLFIPVFMISSITEENLGYLSQPIPIKKISVKPYLLQPLK